MDVRASADHWGTAPADHARRLRLQVKRLGGALLTSAPTSQALHLNRAIGFGRSRSDTEARLDEIVAFYRAARVRRFSVLLMPGPRADTVADWLLDRGFVRRGGKALLARSCRLPVPRGPAGVVVRRARGAGIRRVEGIHRRVFADAPSRRPWALASLAAPWAEHYLASVNQVAVGAGSLRIMGPLAWLGGGATLTGYRRRGAHRALITARLRRAALQGCRWAWVETAIPAPGRPAASFRNLRRLGFLDLGVRPAYVYSTRACD